MELAVEIESAVLIKSAVLIESAVEIILFPCCTAGSINTAGSIFHSSDIKKCDTFSVLL